ncbi:helix-turn-helix transcriptional regulator [Moorellaceae bacterium AZ2]
MEELRILAQRLRDLRKAKRMSAPTLGRKIGLSRSAISRIETLKSAPSLEVLCGLAKALDCTPDFLLGFRDTPVPTTTVEEIWPEGAKIIRKAGETLDEAHKEMLLALIQTFLVQAKREKKDSR